MSYQRASEVPRKGRTEQEMRLEKLLSKMQLSFQTEQVFCFLCRNAFANPDANHYPHHCSRCFTAYDEVGLYCMPDFILNEKGIIYVNGEVHDKNKNIKKDKRQIAELKAAGFKVFVINNDEIDSCTDSGLKMRLFAMYKAVNDEALYTRLYDGEKEYACLR